MDLQQESKNFPQPYHSTPKHCIIKKKERKTDLAALLMGERLRKEREVN